MFHGHIPPCALLSSTSLFSLLYRSLSTSRLEQQERYCIRLSDSREEERAEEEEGELALILISIFMDVDNKAVEPPREIFQLNSGRARREPVGEKREKI